MLIILVKEKLAECGSVAAICDCRGPVSHFYRYVHQDKYHGDGSVPSVCGCCGPISYIHRYFHQDHGDGYVPSVCGCCGQRATFTDTSTRISSMVIALCPQSVAVVD